jgi:hypothetical protein
MDNVQNCDSYIVDIILRPVLYLNHFGDWILSLSSDGPNW